MKFALARLGAVGLVSLSAAELHARSSDFSVALDYSAPSGCPDAAELEAVVRSRLGYDPFVPAARDRVQVHISPRGAFLDGQIEWRDVSGKWAGDQKFRVASSECRGLTRTMALALAVQIQLLADPDASPPGSTTNATDQASTQDDADSATSPNQKPASTPPKPAAKAPASANVRESTSPMAAPRETAEREAHHVLALGAGTGVALGMASEAVLLGRAFGALKSHDWSLELGVELSAPTITRRADGAGFSQQALLVTVAGCSALERWALCLVTRAGEVQMSGKDVDRPNSAAVAVFDGGLRLGFVQPFARRFFLGARGEGLLHFTRWTARLDDVPVWTAPRFAAALGIDAGVQLF